MSEEVKPPVTDLRALMVQQRRDSDLAVINAAFDQLVDKKDRNKVPEDVFKQFFLPFFAGEADINKSPEVLANWITIAGNGFREVEVVDNSGETVAIVPGVNSTLSLQTSNSAINIHEAMRMVEIKGSQIPRRGQDYMIDVFQHKQSEMFSATADSNSETAAKWAKVFQRFNVNTPASGNGLPSVNKEVDLSEDMDFE